MSILNANPGSASGTYTIDPDGTGGNAPFSVTCDMTTAGGGWTVIDVQDFSSTASGWSNSSRSSCGAYGTILGGYGLFGNGSVYRNYSLLGITHTEAHVALSYYPIDSWDGELAYVQMDGVTVWSAIPNFGSGGVQQCGASYVEPNSYSVSQSRSHTNNVLTVTVGSQLDQDTSDESWGMDNAKVMIR